MTLRCAHQASLRFCILNQQIWSVLCAFVKPTWSSWYCFLCKGQSFSCTCCWSFLYVGVQREMLLGKCFLATADILFLLWLISPGWMEGPWRRSGSVWSKLLNYRCFSLPVCLLLSLAGVICIHPSDVKCLLVKRDACVCQAKPPPSLLALCTRAFVLQSVIEWTNRPKKRFEIILLTVSSCVWERSAECCADRDEI